MARGSAGPTSTGGSLSARQISWGLGGSSVTGFVPFLKKIIVDTGARQVCDVGGGAKPVLSLDEVADLNLDYTVLDASAEELDKAPGEYRKLLADVLERDRLPAARFDLVFSRMLAEHVVDPELFHTNIGHMLKPAGRAVHYFPTLYEPVFIANRVLPERVATAALLKLAPWRDAAGVAAKFPAYYRWCRGPTARQDRRFRSVGLEVEL